jgi:hypothetical protein
MCNENLFSETHFQITWKKWAWVHQIAPMFPTHTRMCCSLSATYSTAAQAQHWNWRPLFLFGRSVLNTCCGSYCGALEARSGVRSVISKQSNTIIRKCMNYAEEAWNPATDLTCFCRPDSEKSEEFISLIWTRFEEVCNEERKNLRRRCLSSGLWRHVNL